MTEISASLLLPLDGSDHEFGCSFVKLLRQAGGYIAPNRCGRTEPVRANCTGMTTEEIVSTFWGNSLLWIGAKLRMHGIFDVLKQRTAVFIYGRYCGEAIDECAKLFRDISIKWPVDFGCIHVFGDEEQKRYRSAANRLLDPFNRGVTERDLSTGIPNLGWITIFGGPYISRLDSSAIARVVADTWTPSVTANI